MATHRFLLILLLFGQSLLVALFTGGTLTATSIDIGWFYGRYVTDSRGASVT